MADKNKTKAKKTAKPVAAKKAKSVAPVKKSVVPKKSVPVKKTVASAKKSVPAKKSTAASSPKKKSASPAKKPAAAVKKPVPAKKTVSAKKSVPAKKIAAAASSPKKKPASPAKKTSSPKKSAPAPVAKDAKKTLKPKTPAAEKKSEKKETVNRHAVKYAPDRSDVLTHAERERRRKAADPQKIRELSQKMQFAENASAGTPAPTNQVEMNERVRELDLLSKQQGFVTIEDINRIIPATGSSHEAFDSIINILDNLDIKILDNDEVEAYKLRLTAEEEDALRLAQVDILDDPVRMYLRQMGQVPLLSRDQEIQISRSIEEAESRAGRALLDLAHASRAARHGAPTQRKNGAFRPRRARQKSRISRLVFPNAPEGDRRRRSDFLEAG